jgi:hypothetical protein
MPPPPPCVLRAGVENNLLQGIFALPNLEK